MICPFCKNEGKKSRVFVEGYDHQPLPSERAYYDENGEYVFSKNKIITKTTFSCSSDHYFMEEEFEGEKTITDLGKKPPKFKHEGYPC